MLPLPITPTPTFIPTLTPTPPLTLTLTLTLSVTQQLMEMIPEETNVGTIGDFMFKAGVQDILDQLDYDLVRLLVRVRVGLSQPQP